jgi:hypothetical protein
MPASDEETGHVVKRPPASFSQVATGLYGKPKYALIVWFPGLLEFFEPVMNLRKIVWVFLVATCGSALALAEVAKQATVQTNQSYIEDVTRRMPLPLADKQQMFTYVFDSLPERVTVYPTENYYYFSFHHNGVRYGGNIRLDPESREQGKLNFAYFAELTEWIPRNDVQFAVLGKENGVAVEKVEPLLYRVTHNSKSVLFALNDLSGVKPPAGALGSDDKFIGPIFDESGIRFLLVFNTKLKLFHYLLDETVPVADELMPTAKSERLLIGRRTGFAFYRDHKLARKILVGVFAVNSEINNYFDGPFDQLPDNFIKGDELRDAIIAADPSQKGKIDRYGNSPDGNSRYLIAPYLYYTNEEDLALFDRCTNDKKIPADFYPACFVVNDDRSTEPAKPAPAKPLAPKGKK